MATAEKLVFDFLMANLIDPPKQAIEEGESVEETKPAVPKQLEPIHVETFEELLDHYAEQNFDIRNFPNTRSTLAVMLATALTQYFGGNEMILLYVRGAPSSGKSTLCEAVSANRDICLPISTFTGFHSGMKSKSKKNLSPLELMRNKCVVIKDYTSTILGLPDAMQKQMHGDLRDLTDGSSEATYKNGVKRHVKNFRISMIGGVTDEIQNHQNASLGSRFISVDIMDDFHGSHEHVSGALNSITRSILDSFQKRSDKTDSFKAVMPPDKMEMIKRYTSGYLVHCYNRFLTMDEPQVSPAFVDKVTSMAILVGKVRAEVKRKAYGNDIAYRPRAEIGIRLGAQLMKVAVALSVIYNKRNLDATILRDIRKISKDTAEGFNFDIVTQICKAQDKGELGVDKGQLQKRLDLPISLIAKRLEDMRFMGLIRHVVSTNGATRSIWELRPEHRKLWKDLNGTIKPVK